VNGFRIPNTYWCKQFNCYTVLLNDTGAPGTV
jgi:hypothetical protein